jgi:hypothetical protein
MCPPRLGRWGEQQSGSRGIQRTATGAILNEWGWSDVGGKGRKEVNILRRREG